MGFYLLDNPNPNGPFYYTTRRGKILAMVVHITAGLEDLDATNDHSAEATARYAATTSRPVSWHLGSDTDSGFHLLPASYTAFHVRGYNSTTIGHEISKRITDWSVMSPAWVGATLTQAARLAAPIAHLHGIPARHATKAELDREIARGGQGVPVGFISHAQLDPTRRSDPGMVSGRDTFPWARYLDLIVKHASPTTPTLPGTQEPDMMLVTQTSTGNMWLFESGGADPTTFGRRTLIPSSDEKAWLASDIPHAPASDTLFDRLIKGRPRIQ